MFDRQDVGIEEYLCQSELIGVDWIRLRVKVSVSISGGGHKRGLPLQ